VRITAWFQGYLWKGSRAQELASQIAAGTLRPTDLLQRRSAILVPQPNLDFSRIGSLSRRYTFENALKGKPLYVLKSSPKTAIAWRDGGKGLATVVATFHKVGDRWMFDEGFRREPTKA
jgi:hypothetical protein